MKIHKYALKAAVDERAKRKENEKEGNKKRNMWPRNKKLTHLQVGMAPPSVLENPV
jgi:hypothetical protein